MIAVIGSTGKLGSELTKYPETKICPLRFEDSQEKWINWFSTNKVHTIFHVARACRKQGIRRDTDTFLLELSGMQKLLNSVSPDTRIVYASTKVVYGLHGLDDENLTVSQIAADFFDNKVGISNSPSHLEVSQIDTSKLLSDDRSYNRQHLVYVMTKLACEQLITVNCNNYSIIRLWDF